MLNNEHLFAKFRFYTVDNELSEVELIVMLSILDELVIFCLMGFIIFFILFRF